MSGRSARNRVLGIVCVIAVLSAIPLAGCTATPTPAEPVTITFAYLRGGDGEYYQGFARVFEEEYPHITVEVRQFSPEEERERVTVDADVYWLAESLVGASRKEGRIVSLDALMEQDLTYAPSDFYPGVLEALSFDGEAWAAPAGIDVAVVFYNRDLFDEYGVSYPEVGWTWDDFVEKSLAVRDPDATLLGDASEVFGYGPVYARAALQFVYQHGGRIVDDPYAPTRATFDDPLTIDALEWYADLFHRHDVALTLQQAEEAYGARVSRASAWLAVLDGIQAGRVAMWDGSFAARVNRVFGNWFFEWGMAPPPRDEQQAALFNVETYVISSASLHPQACWQWISFLSHQALPSTVPPRRSIAESEAFEQLVGSEEASVVRASMEGGVPFPRAIGGVSVYGAFADAVTEIVEEEVPPAEALAEAQRQFE